MNNIALIHCGLGMSTFVQVMSCRLFEAPVTYNLQIPVNDAVILRKMLMVLFGY